MIDVPREVRFILMKNGFHQTGDHWKYTLSFNNQILEITLILPRNLLNPSYDTNRPSQ